MLRKVYAGVPILLLGSIVALCAMLEIPSREARAASGANVTIATQATYRAAEQIAVAVSSSTGDIAELRGAATHVARVKRITIAKPSVSFTLRIEKRSTLDASGTPTTPAMVPMDSVFNSVSGVTVQGYTAKPTKGTLVGLIYPPIAIGTSDVLTVEFGEQDKQACAVRSGEAVALVTDTAATISYMIEYEDTTY